MASLTLNSLKHVMRAVVDSPGFDRVLSKVNMDSLCQLVFGLSAEKSRIVSVLLR